MELEVEIAEGAGGDTRLSWVEQVWEDAGRWPVVGTVQPNKLEV